jgi:RNA polymerase sigma-70 factor (ECF subfamily)
MPANSEYNACVMQSLRNGLIRTRTTLINRLKNWQDQASWQDFFDTYWKLIFGVAIKSGLSETEAQDVVQETMIAVARNIPNFEYDRALGSFKTWLLNMTRWRITDQFRKRSPLRVSEPVSDDDSAGHTPLDNVADRAHLDLEAVWEEEWKKNLLEAAIIKVRRTLDPQQYQLFHLYVNKEWPPDKVAKTFKVSVNQVYLAKHRVTEMVRDEVKRLAKSTP